VYLNGNAILDLTSSNTQVRVRNLASGTSDYAFTVTAIGGNSQESAASNLVSASTKALSGGKAIINVKDAFASPSSAVYQADILIPYAFNRIFIGPHTLIDGSTDSCGWPVVYTNYYTYGYFCANFMVKGTTLYQYSGLKGYVPATLVMDSDRYCEYKFRSEHLYL
jgi:hypothetical protein